MFGKILTKKEQELQQLCQEQFVGERRRAPLARVHRVRIPELVTRCGRVEPAPQDGEEAQPFEEAQFYIGPGNGAQGLRGLTIRPDGHIRH